MVLFFNGNKFVNQVHTLEIVHAPEPKLCACVRMYVGVLDNEQTRYTISVWIQVEIGRFLYHQFRLIAYIQDFDGRVTQRLEFGDFIADGFDECIYVVDYRIQSLFQQCYNFIDTYWGRQRRMNPQTAIFLEIDM